MMKKLLFFSFLLSSYFSFSQCDDPISMATPVVLNASCQSNGEISVVNILPVLGGSDYYQYSLFNNTNNTETYTWQDANVFSNLSAGNYEVRVRKRCSLSPTMSAGYIAQTVTVNGTEVPSAFSSVSVLRNDKCTDGEVSAVALGSGPLEFALVSSLTEAEPIAAYVSPRQSTSRFSGLAAGNYFMRVYNACDNASTIPFTIESELSNTTVTPLAGYFIPVGCDSVTFSFNVTTYFKNTPNFPNDMLTKAWIIWPSGTVDSLDAPNQSNSNLLTPRTSRLTKKAHISEIDPAYDPALFWPDNLSSPTYTITFGYRDVCGVIHTNTYTYTKTTTTDLYARADPNHVDSDCDNLAYRFAIRHSGGGGTTTMQGFGSYHNFEYSLDNGMTWLNATSSNASSVSTGYSYTDFMVFPRGVAQTIQMRYCGRTLTNTFSPLALTSLTSTLTTDVATCLNKGRIRIRNYNATGPIIGVKVLSKPASETTLPSNFETTLSSAAYTDPIEFSNLEPGTYEIQLFDTSSTCKFDKTITIEVLPFTFDFDFNVTCNKNLEINNVVPLGTTSGFRVMIFNSLNVKVFGGTSGVSISSVTNKLNIPGSSMASWPDGTYRIRVARGVPSSTNYNCVFIDKIWIKSSNNNLSLQNSIFISGCEDGSAAVGASASGGVAPYEYTLLDGSNNVISPTALGANTYNNLDELEVYRLNVLDSCGSSVNRMISSNSEIQILALGYNTMPCLNDNVTLYLPNFTGVSYAWLKDSVLIPSATSNTYSLPNLHLVDAGDYQAAITIGGCVVSGTLYINPLDCGGPLAVELTSFYATCDENGSVYLGWETASELNSLDFVLQKSVDLKNWEVLDVLPAQGNSNVLNKYTTIDRNAGDDVTYYQLIQRDIDGAERKYSPISNSCNSGNENQYNLYPNPSAGDFTIDFISEKKSKVTVQIVDMEGRMISSQTHQTELGKNTLFISANLVKGVYVIRIETDKKEISPIKLVVN